MSNYKTFDYFVNAYFHQDWREEAKNSEAILELFLTSEDIENIRSLKKDVENIIENEDINQFFTKNVIPNPIIKALPNDEQWAT